MRTVVKTAHASKTHVRWQKKKKNYLAVRPLLPLRSSFNSLRRHRVSSARIHEHSKKRVKLPMSPRRRSFSSKNWSDSSSSFFTAREQNRSWMQWSSVTFLKETRPSSICSWILLLNKSGTRFLVQKLGTCLNKAVNTKVSFRIRPT